MRTKGSFMADFKLRPEEIKHLTDIKGGCLASNKITIDGEKVGYAYREEPDNSFPNDSGWRFFAGTEDDDYTNSPDNFNVFELNTVCNYDNTILPILESKIGSSYIRKGVKMIPDGNDLDFPDNATEEERSITWQKIAEISDADFGFNTPKDKTGKTRFCVRILMQNDKGEICAIKSEKYGYMQLPGGGIDEGESIIEALRRETEEETGFSIKTIKPIGYTLEKREDVRNTHNWDRDISYVFSALPDKEVGTKYMEDEIAEGFKPIWIKLEDFIAEQESNEGKIDSYSGCFSNKRDLEIARYFKSMKDQ